jgi:hypothetical protein
MLRWHRELARPKFRGCARDSTHPTSADSTLSRYKTAKSQDLWYPDEVLSVVLTTISAIQKG